MRRTTGGALVLAALLAAGATNLAAQRRAAGQRGPGMDARTGGVEAIMNIRDRLELTDDQINSLEALRQSGVQRRNDLLANMNELRSQLEAGQIDRGQFAEAVREQREAAGNVAGQGREQIDAILTEPQLATLEEMRGRARAFARGRASANRRGAGARGSRGGAGMRPGNRWRGPAGGSGPGFRGRSFPGRFGPDGMRPIRGPRPEIEP